MASRAERNQIVLGIMTGLAAKLPVMNLKIVHRAAQLSGTVLGYEGGRTIRNSGLGVRVLVRPNSRRFPGCMIKKRFSFFATMNAIIICVPTPLNEYHEPDMSYITGKGAVPRLIGLQECV